MEEKNSLMDKPSNRQSTTWIGYAFIMLAFVMVVVKYLLPLFIVLKEKPEELYKGWVILIVVAVGILLVYLNEEYFGQLFKIGTKYAQKKTGTDDTKTGG